MLEPQSNVIILRLVGEYKGAPVLKAATTRTIVNCETCGHKSRSSIAKFCNQCGASLKIIN